MRGLESRQLARSPSKLAPHSVKTCYCYLLLVPDCLWSLSTSLKTSRQAKDDGEAATVLIGRQPVSVPTGRSIFLTL